MAATTADVFTPPPAAPAVSITDSLDEKLDSAASEPGTPPSLRSEKAPLAERGSSDPASSFGDAVLRCVGLRKRRAVHSLDAIATQESVYDTDQARFYQPRADWENIRNFDPDFRWTWREQRKVLWKIDWKIMSWMLVMFLALDIDRANLANATADNILSDLGLTTNDYNLGNTLARVGFLVAELPSQLIAKRIGPDRWIPIQLCVFSIIAASQFWLSGKKSFLATRFLIAAFQGGFIPDCILAISYYYTKTELPVRLAAFWCMNYFANLVTGFLAVGFLKLRGVGGHAGWRWMFLIEGILTLIVGIASFFMMPASPSQTKTWFRPNGYFTDREVKIIVNKVIRDDPGKGGMHNRQALTVRTIVKCLGNYHMYPLYIIGLTFGLATYPISNYLQLSFKSLGFSTAMANLLSVPNTVLSMINVGKSVDAAMHHRSDNPTPWTFFAITTVLLGFPYVHAIQVSWASRNSGTVELRTVSASVYNMFVQASAIVGANIYQKSDAPRYHKGNRALLGIIAMNVVVLCPAAYRYYSWQNRHRSQRWNAMSLEERTTYLQTTTDKGNQRLNFEFAR